MEEDTATRILGHERKDKDKKRKRKPRHGDEKFRVGGNIKKGKKKTGRKVKVLRR